MYVQGSGRVRKGLDDAFQQGDFQAFLHKHIKAEVTRYRARHGEVICGTVYCQGTDIPAGKFQWLYSEAIRGKQHFLTSERQGYGVGLGIQAAVGQVPGEDLLDQFPHEPAAVAVGE